MKPFKKSNNEMKTAEQFLMEICPDADFWFSETAREKIERAMKAYAEQAIDRAAQQAEINDNAGILKVSNCKCKVDKESILAVKNELK